MRRAAAAAALALALASCRWAGAAGFSVSAKPIEGCRNGRALVATFPFGDPKFAKEHSFVVFHDGVKTLDQAREALSGRGLEPVALVNGGYFGGGAVYSYYKSSSLGLEHGSNSLFSPRACLVHDARTRRFSVRQSEPGAYAGFKAAKAAEILCSGPQLVEGGENVAKKRACSECFDPACREDKKDPGLGYSASLPRTGSCVTADGSLKLFSFNSPTHRCGATIEELAEAMVAEGCSSGLNHDGGGSAKLFLDSEGREIVARGSENRAVPVWAAVVRPVEPRQLRCLANSINRIEELADASRRRLR